MPNRFSIPTKRQAIAISCFSLFLLSRALINTDLLTSPEFSNRQYFIFGLLITLATALSLTSALVYWSEIKKKAN